MKLEIRTDGKFIYANGFKVAVLVAKPQSRVVAEHFLDLVQSEFKTRDDGETREEVSYLECPSCGHEIY